MLKTLLLVAISEFWMTCGHICFKKSAQSFQWTTSGVSSFVIMIIQRPLIWIGIIFMILGLSFWLLALHSAELSVVYSMGSVQYVFILFASYFFLGEKIDIYKLIGTLLIMTGIVLVTNS